MIKKINKKNKFKNTKLYRGLVIGSSIIVMGTSLVSCSPNEEVVKGMISSDMSFEESLDLVSDKTNIDEILNDKNYIELLNNYKNSRKEKDINKITNALNVLGNSIVNASIADTLINDGLIESYNDLVDINIEYSPVINEFGVKEKDQYLANVTYINGNKTANGNIEVANDYTNRKYLLEGKLFDLVYSLNNMDSENINLEYTDEIFKSLEMYLFTTGKINENHYKYDGTITNKYDLEKVKTLR